ncbi:MAG: tryptophan synthase subunit alpha [Solirubrobacterales bacterium]
MASDTAVSGVERIGAAFEAARAEGRAALMPYLMAGYPDAESSWAVAEAYVAGGADLVELGIPYSDPLADGPVIHAAATAALEAGTTFADALAVGATIADRVPVVAMMYANMVYALGATALAERLAGAGVAGAIVPDLPHEEAGPIRTALAAAGLALIPLVAPTTTPERRQAICRDAQGFVYVVSVTGVTGERTGLPPGLEALVDEVRLAAPVPAAVGFGVGSPEQAAEVATISDGVIIGSRLVREAGEGDGAEGCRSFLADVRAALAGSWSAADRPSHRAPGRAGPGAGRFPPP